MDNPPLLILSQTVPKLQPHRTHTRNASRSPTRERFNLSDDILADLSPATTLEAFTNPSGKLKASVENATQSERAFGIRATLASKKIQEWLDELSNWSWPTNGGCEGFEMPPIKRRKTVESTHDNNCTVKSTGASDNGVEYIGSLPIDTFDRYELRVEEITEDMEDLDVEDIKRQVLDTHFSPRSRPSSSASSAPMPSLFASYTKMDDFTAIVTATVLHALPNLSKLMRLMDVWKLRLAVLSKVPPLLSALDEIETALKMGWNALGKSSSHGRHGVRSAPLELSRETFDKMRDGLQDKVTALGRDLDFMLDTLEGREDTLPDIWLDRMEAIEHDYGEWVVYGDRKIREAEWAEMMKAREEADDKRRLEEVRVAEEAQHKEEIATADRIRIVEEQATDQAEDSQQRAKGEALSDNLDAELSEGNALDSVIAMEPPTVTGSIYRAAEGLNEEQIPANAPAVEPLSSGLEYTHANEAPGSHPGDEGADEPSELSRPASQKDIGMNENDIEVKVADDSPDTASLGVQRLESIPVAGERQAAAVPDSNEFSTPAQPNLEPILPDLQQVQFPTLSDSDILRKSEAEERPKPLPMATGLLAKMERVAESPTSSKSIQKSPEGQPQVPRFSHTVANMLRRTSSPAKPSQDVLPPVRSSISAGTHAQIFALHDGQIGNGNHSKSALSFERRPATSSGVPEPQEHASTHGDWSLVDSYKAQSPKPQESTSEDSYVSTTSERTSKRHSRNISTISEFPLSFPPPETGSAETIDYFRPALGPVVTKPPSHENNQQKAIDIPPDNIRKSPTVRTRSPDVASSHVCDEIDQAEQLPVHCTSIALHEIAEPNTIGSANQYHEGVNMGSSEVEQRASAPSTIKVPRKLSLIPPEPPRPVTASSDTPTIVASWGDGSTSPAAPSTIDGNDDHFLGVDEPSPSAGRVGLRPTFDHNRSPSGSPPSVSIPPTRRQPLHSPTSPTLSLSSEPSESSASSLADAPTLEDVDIQHEAPPLSSPKKRSEDQLQQQISSLLESIPARIHLTSEPDMTATNTLRPKKTRRSVTPSFRSQSSLSNRASTPSFLLSPAYSKTTSRPRPQNAHPEIKLYHLSRSADEAPIKLFVRLVGGNGERVMVRVGGGWADLGEYLKEYASHHGRRSKVDDKIEIQDLPPRNVSNSSTTSNATIRGFENGRSSPMPNIRPGSAFDRPASSLNVRKTRKSLGESAIGQRHDLRSPSTPLPMLNRRSLGDSPPPPSTITTTRSSSRLSWAEDDSSLGLAGPKGKKVAISEKDQEWVESMKEKVKQASAEKDREKEREKRLKEKARGASFGEMDKVGGTKRVFRKGLNQKD